MYRWLFHKTGVFQLSWLNLDSYRPAFTALIGGFWGSSYGSGWTDTLHQFLWRRVCRLKPSTHSAIINPGSQQNSGSFVMPRRRPALQKWGQTILQPGQKHTDEKIRIAETNYSEGTSRLLRFGLKQISLAMFTPCHFDISSHNLKLQHCPCFGFKTPGLLSSLDEHKRRLLETRKHVSQSFRLGSFQTFQ